ncbi:universal stress protein [Nocardia aurea]|uniref:Universal stress protein n=1 Tax=Nocardia aurea TaxID=2144174 RepID=A0ABV3FS88_9NOCA
MSPNNNHSIVVGIDGSADGLAAVRWAAIDAARRGARLDILEAIVAPTEFGPGIAFDQYDYERFREQGRDALDAASETAATAAGPIGELVLTTDLVEAPPIPTLRDRSKNADMIVVGTRGHGAFGRTLLGSVSTALARHAECPVAVIPKVPETAGEPGPVVVGVDGSTCSNRAVEIAFDQAARRGTDVVAVLTWSESFRYVSRDDLQQQGEVLLSESLAGYGETYPDVAVRRVVVEDRPAKRLLATGEHAELIVVGSHGRGGFAGMTLGSVSQAVLHGAQVPVIIARTS